MLRAVLDAHVLVSALLRPAGPPGEILRLLLEKEAFELVLTPGIAEETARALGYPRVRKRLPKDFVPADWIEDLALLAILVEDGPGPGACRDPDDDRYLAAALAGRAAYLVTGDDDLLSLREHEGVLVIPPRRFLGLLSPAGGLH